MNATRDLIRGLWEENPTFVLMLGLCPTLAVTTSVVNGFAMGVATTFVLVSSGLVISSIRRFIPNEMRIPCYIVIVATFVTIADMFLAAYYVDIHKVLGLYIPLIVVNCIILGRIEAFASKNPVTNSLADAIGIGLGYMWALMLVGSVREILGAGTFLGFDVSSGIFNPAAAFIMPAGAFLTIGFMMAFFNRMFKKRWKTCC
ncbi:MAG: electron transport complex subunit E [Candidatus Altiarchaeota archaeon]